MYFMRVLRTAIRKWTESVIVLLFLRLLQRMAKSDNPEVHDMSDKLPEDWPTPSSLSSTGSEQVIEASQSGIEIGTVSTPPSPPSPRLSAPQPFATLFPGLCLASAVVPTTSHAPTPRNTSEQNIAVEQKARLMKHICDTSTELIATLPPPSVPIDIDMRLAVLDLEDAIKQLETLETRMQACGREVRGEDLVVLRKRKESKVLQLQRKIVSRADMLLHSETDFGEAVTKLRVRLALYDQLA